jgi:hypothetical protein
MISPDLSTRRLVGPAISKRHSRYRGSPNAGRIGVAQTGDAFKAQARALRPRRQKGGKYAHPMSRHPRVSPMVADNGSCADGLARA